MAMYVYKDEGRTDKLIARNAHKQDKGNRYFCPNPQCDAHMYIRNIDGVSASYFGAISSHGHILGCPFGTSNGFNPNNHDESKFDFPSALQALTMPSKPQSRKETPGEHGHGLPTRKPPRTIRQIYSMCREHDCFDTYNGVTIGEMLLDDRSLELYPQGVLGWRVVTANCKKYFYDAVKREIYLVAPTQGKKYTLILKFDDETLYKKIKNIVFSNKEYLIVVAGQWIATGNNNEYCTILSSKKQLAIIK